MTATGEQTWGAGPVQALVRKVPLGHVVVLNRWAAQVAYVPVGREPAFASHRAGSR